MVFYLKINRDVDYTLNNLRSWLEAVSCIPESVAFILCDNESLGKKVEELILPDFSECDISLLESDRETKELVHIAESVVDPGWFKCACSHLTTFFHSKKNGFEAFWNIDADDTSFCISKERLAQILIKVQEYADQNGLGCFSLDMWTSRNLGNVWSFGITYTRNSYDWVDVMMKHCQDANLSGYIPGHTKNLDLYFTFLRDTCKELNISAFCVNNLRFVHYGNDMYRNPIGTGFFHWKDGMLLFPLLFFFYGSRSIGKYKIADNVVVFDIAVTDRESLERLNSFFPEYDVELEHLFLRRPYENVAEIEQDFRLYSGQRTKFVLFGCGNEGKAMLKRLGEDKVICFADNYNYGKVVEGKKVISLDELKKMDFKSFTLLITAFRGYSKIIKTLEDNGIFNYHVSSLY